MLRIRRLLFVDGCMLIACWLNCLLFAVCNPLFVVCNCLGWVNGVGWLTNFKSQMPAACCLVLRRAVRV